MHHSAARDEHVHISGGACREAYAKKRCYSWGCQTKRTYCVLASTAGSKTGRSIVGKLINAACEDVDPGDIGEVEV